MKKIVLLFCFAVFCVSCDPPQKGWRWIVVNSTGQTLKLTYPADNMSATYWTQPIAPDASLSIYGRATDKKDNLYFDDFFKSIVSRYGEDVYWQILSEDDVVLKTWKFSDEHLSNPRFFEESSWNKEATSGNEAFITTECSWTFEILPEDIIP